MGAYGFTSRVKRKLAGDERYYTAVVMGCKRRGARAAGDETGKKSVVSTGRYIEAPNYYYFVLRSTLLAVLLQLSLLLTHTVLYVLRSSRVSRSTSRVASHAAPDWLVLLCYRTAIECTDPLLYSSSSARHLLLLLYLLW